MAAGGRCTPVSCLGRSGDTTAMASTGARLCMVMAGTTSTRFGGQMASNSPKGKQVGSSLEGTRANT
jgi:hypothetical protein